MIYTRDDLPCKLCEGEGSVNVFPLKSGGNDMQADECPWCLRRALAAKDAEIERLREALAKISRLPNSGERSSGDYAKIAIDALAGGEES